MNLQFCFEARCSRSRPVAAHSHPSLELVYCTAGRFRTTFSRRRFELAPQSFSIVPATIPHDQVNLTDAVTICMGVDASGLESFAGAWADPGGILQAPLTAMCRELRGRERGYDMVARGLLLEVVALAQRQILREADGDMSPHEHIVRRALEIIEHRDGALSVAEVAAQLFISPDFLRHLFQRHADGSPNHYIAQARLARAKVLLRQPGMAVAETARLCGFENVHYFSRFFRKATGRTATEFRQDRPGPPAST
ncbi:MAG: helix-turn-helix transcriptional regulator [Planctomycetes bacterium]|nr:helix-turn-helix transcriptional regulator [Planctomycetota bacterium]